MPLTDPDALTDMIDAHAKITRRTARRIADAGVDRLERNVKRRTPIDTNPFRHDPARPRGTARKSVHRKERIVLVVRGGRESYKGEVLSDDPIARLIEFDTAPHRIRAKDGGFLRFQSRHGFVDRAGEFHPPGTWVSVREIEHPGTKGSHAFSLGAYATEHEYRQYATDALARWEREIEGVHT